MKKFAVIIAAMLAAGLACAISTEVVNPVYVQTTAVIAEGVTSVAVTNTSTTGFVWQFKDAYGVCSSAAANADTVTVYVALAAAPTVFYPVDTGSIVSNGTSLRIDFDGIVQLSSGDIIKYVRTATSTNTAIKIVMPNLQFK